MSDIKRRDFLKVLGLSGAGAGLVGCAQEPAQKLIPYLVPPEEVVPGIPDWMATACGECPAGCGLHVKLREGRPIKVEGNPDHPLNGGKLCAMGQSSVQGLYNPDRITGPLRRVAGTDELEPISWDAAEELLAERISELRRTGATDRTYLITGAAMGSLDRLFDAWMEAIGSPNRLIHDSFDLEPLREANRLTFGLAEIPRYELDRAELLLSFGAGFLESWISPVAHARRFGRSHGLRAEGRKARFIHVAPRLSLTGSNADEWVAARPGTATDLALAMVNVLISEGQAGARGESIRSMVADYTPERAAERADVEVETIVRLAREFAGSPASLALPPGTEGTGTDATGAHIAVNLLNYVADNLGRTVRFGPNVLRRSASGLARTQAAADAMRGGEVELVFVHGADPVHTLPGGLEFATALDNVGLVVAFASYMDETAARADLILPDHTPLERWGDQEPEEGVHNLLQPTIRPIFDTKATPDALLSIAARVGGDVARALPWSDYRTYLREAWREIGREHAPGRPFEEFWQESLSRGGVWREVATRPVTLSTTVTNYDFRPTSLEGEQAAELALLTYPSPNLYDGRGANRPWLQELPDPMTKVVWNSWVEVHPETAEGMGVGTGDVVELTTQQGRLEAPVYVYEGIRRDAVAIPIGQGHRHYGRYARDRGVNPLELLPAAADLASGGAAWLSTRVRVRPVGRRERLVVTQGADTDHGRDIAELVGLSTAAEHERRARDEIRSNPDALVDAAEDADPKSPYRWGMVIDLASCTGCSACVTACYAENNVPVVGEANCANRREMSWIRIERYYEHLVEGNGHGGGHDGGSAAQHGAAAAVAGDGHTVHVPMLCQHCGNAPCEPVCPVYATYHNAEGLNVQVYNRCVGTRYCSNNCPYKVRRFEWFDYEYPFPLNLQLNPDVTVREKGVMEKCTFCVQRIQAAKYEAKAEGRPVADGEVVPACAQTCPTDAIVFGNLRDPNSRVSRLARSGRSYHVLEELNTRPAITYLEEVVRGPGEG